MRPSVLFIVLVSIVLLPESRGQTTVAYDTGFGDGTKVSYPGSRIIGNCFTGLNPAVDISQITAFFNPGGGLITFHVFDGCMSGDPRILITNQAGLPSGVDQTVTKTGISADFAGTSVFVGIRGYISGSRANSIFLQNAGSGTHALAVDAAGNLAGLAVPAGFRNVEIRITGPMGLPVELVEFAVE